MSTRALMVVFPGSPYQVKPREALAALGMPDGCTVHMDPRVGSPHETWAHVTGDSLALAPADLGVKSVTPERFAAACKIAAAGGDPWSSTADAAAAPATARKPKKGGG